MKHKDGTTASIPRVPSGALEGIQPKLLHEACLAKEKPPLLIMRVLGAMCLLLEENPTWLVARQLIVDSETNMTMAGEDADTASKMSLIERLRNLNISRISEKTLHRLRRVVEHAGPNFLQNICALWSHPTYQHLRHYASMCSLLLIWHSYYLTINGTKLELLESCRDKETIWETRLRATPHARQLRNAKRLIVPGSNIKAMKKAKEQERGR